MTDIIMQCAITNVYKHDGQAMVTLTNLPSSPDVIARVFADIADIDIQLDIINQSSPHDDIVDLSFSMSGSDMDACISMLQKYACDSTSVISHSALSKLTMEGAGMQRQSGVASRLFGALAGSGIGIYIITTSDTNISFCIDTEKTKDAIRVIAKEFSL